MNRMIALFLCMVLLLSLFAGCGSKEAETQTEESEQVEVTQPEGEYTIAREINTNQLTFYWKANGVDYSKCDMWIWYENMEPRGYSFHETGNGGKVMLNVPLNVSEVGFVVRKNCSDPGGTSWGEATRDVEVDRYAVMKGDTMVWLKEKDPVQYFSKDGGKTLIPTKQISLATIDDVNQINYFLTTPTQLNDLNQVKVLDGEQELSVTDLSSMDSETTTGTITLGQTLDITKTYVVEIEGYGSQKAIPNGIFDTQSFQDQYCYNGNDLGATVRDGETTFKLWAPTAREVRLDLFSVGNGGVSINQIALSRGDHGVWSTTAKCGHGTYYLYNVTTARGTQRVVDPYAKAVGINGERAMVVDLDSTDPEGFAEDQFYQGVESYNEAVLWETHVRDFSVTNSGSQYPGKYLAFTETGLTNSSGESVGLDYLKNLGITHVQLQPIFDFDAIDETSKTAKFNWGYSPKNFNAPEGSYSTDPYHGEVRVKEVKQMVQALHNSGIGVVMDVAYNHTYDINSNLSRAVPYYYYRYNSSGAPSNGSGYGNETASERTMFRKFIVDSVSYWAKEYHIDGFRFDMMSLYDVETMQAIETAVHAVNPKAIIYGESRTGGGTVLSASLQANQNNIKDIHATRFAIGGVAVYNDTFREGIRGTAMDSRDQGYINGKANETTAQKIIFGLVGGEKSSGVNWSVDDNMVANYLSGHNNATLWDKLQQANSSASEADRYAMYRLAEEILFMGKGMPVLLGGEELLRSKRGDSNSYKSSDSINNIDWNQLSSSGKQRRMRNLVRLMIALRKENDFFTKGKVACEMLNANVIRVSWTMGGSVVAVGLINPNDKALSANLPDGHWEVLFAGETSDLEKVGGKDVLIVTAPGVAVLPSEEVEIEQIDPDSAEEEDEDEDEDEETEEEP
ncbi:MAG: type I pullulanase [Oscillospiraceae bacterium]|nr:type I pullulanase [Oscillospiraceae bacterium]